MQKQGPFSVKLDGKVEPLYLDKNENPFRLPPSLREEIRQLVSTLDLNRYPDPNAEKVRRALSNLTGIPHMNLIAGNGGDEILSMIFRAFVKKGSKVLTLSPSFSQYQELCLRHEAALIPFPLEIGESGIGFDENLFEETLAKETPEVLLLDTPNNPTGKSLPNAFLARLSESFPGVMVVDEAYGEFASLTFLETFKGRELPRGLCILKTLSKAWGMAGLRFGYAACSEWIWNKLEGVRDIYNVGLLSQEIASVVLQYREWMESRVLSIRYMRDQFIRAINRIPGWRAYESASNFVLVRTGLPKALLLEGLSAAGIHVKPVELEGSDTWIRITIGKEEEMGRFLDFAQRRP